MKDYKRIILKDVNKSFGNKKALNDFSAVFNKGEFITFLGPSGCGKSTALNCIAGLLPITSGGIYIDDECVDDSVNRVQPEKREFGMVFQNYALFPHLSVFNNIAFGLQLRKIAKNSIKERVDKVLKMVHLEAYQNKYPAQLSGGEQQRVAIARCIILEPRLLMLDEPLSNLDAKLREDMRYELIALHNRLQITTIYVTHDQTEALALSDRIVVIKDGFIQQTGTPAEIYTRPANLFVADFMGFKNIWHAKITSMKEAGSVMEINLDVDRIPLLIRLEKTMIPDERISGLVKAYEKKEDVYCAVRPEDIETTAGQVNNLSCRIEVAEYLGQTFAVNAILENEGRADFRTNLPSRIHETRKIHIPPAKIQIFTKGGA